MAELGGGMLDSDLSMLDFSVSDISMSEPASQKPATATRACDYCRQRKAGCSRERPQCRNCKNVKRLCTYTDPVLRKENPAVKISAQLSSLGSRLSRIESLLPSLKQSPSLSSSVQPPDYAPSESVSESTPERLSRIESRIDGIDVKLGNIHALLSVVARVANRECSASEPAGNPFPKSMIQKRMSISETDHAAHESLGDDLQLNLVGDPLVSDDDGNTLYPGRSSAYSFSADAELLAQSTLKGLEQTSLNDGNQSSVQSARVCSLNSSPNRPQEKAIVDWEANQLVEGREEANHLAGISMCNIGDMHMGVVITDPRIPSRMAQGVPPKLDNALPNMTGEAAEVVGLGRNKVNDDGDFYIPTAQEVITILDRVYTGLTSGAPIFSNIPPGQIFARLFESPSRFLLETDYDQSWVTIGYCLAYFALSYGLTIDDPGQRRSELVLKRYMARNAWASFKDMKLFFTPTIEHVQALVLLGVVAQDTSRPGLFWMLTCQACRLAQTMGLHRPLSHTLTPAEVRMRRHLFWVLYTVDKSFSLSFGRTSSFQDYDCDVEYPKLSEVPYNPDMEPSEIVACFHPEYFMAMIQLAKLQSAVYKKLYSARASNSQGHNKIWVKETEKWVWELDSRLRIWKKSLSYLESIVYTNSIPKTIHFHDDIIILMKCLECQYHSLMTMVHRRLFRPTAGDDDGEASTEQNTRKRSRAILLNSARSALKALRTLSEYKDYTEKKWSLIYQPFAPFFVLFSKIVTNPASPTNDLDIGLMSEVGKFLGDIRAQVQIGASKAPTTGEQAEMDGINRFLTVVNAFIGVAKSFIKRDKERVFNAAAKGNSEEPSGDADSDKSHDTVGSPAHTIPSSSCSDSSSPFSFPLTGSRTSPYPHIPLQNLQSEQTPITSCDPGILHWNSVMSINKLQELVSMDIDIDVSVDAMYQGAPGHPEIFKSAQVATSSPAGESKELVFNHDSGMSSEIGTISSAQDQIIQSSWLGIDDTYLTVFETAVRQGAMDFDWINWEI